ncbi:MAG TPA: exopolysaccharide biosynthesis polyprenyl glycosylphosphotransferase [Alphaproteobacteria bacterium]|nr:exopolysaccharide biosynthesis polyprenyl glycosylphosphotransferase [Alphaproteobacteria bacterium]
MFAYFLSSKSYQAFVTPHRDLWPADFKLIAVLLIMSPAFLLAVRAVFGEKPGSVSRRAGLWLLAGANTAFIVGISVTGYWASLPQSVGDVRAIGWAVVWMVVPFIVIEMPRASARSLARARSPRAVILATPGSMGRLRRDEATLADAFDTGNVYGLGETTAFGETQVKGGLDDLIEYGRQHGLNKIVVASLKSEGEMVSRTADRLVPLAADIYACAIDEEDEAADHVLKLVVRRPIGSGGLVLKSLEDFCLGAALTFFFAPLMGFIALAIWIDSSGPIFFKQKRHGYRHREIEVFKFRTMRVEKLDYACAEQTKRGDPRITRVGRFLRKSSLDELPQLLNVVRGEMSLVGPRPHAVNMRTAQKLSHEIVPTYAHRHCVKPGITGWAQINGHRGALDAEEQLVNRVNYDMDYIRKWSVGFDIAILFKTIFHVVDTKNAF